MDRYGRKPNITEPRTSLQPSQNDNCRYAIDPLRNSPELGNHAPTAQYHSNQSHRMLRFASPPRQELAGLRSLCKPSTHSRLPQFRRLQPASFPVFPYWSDRYTNWRYYLSPPSLPAHSFAPLPFKERSFVSWMFVDFPFACTFARQRGRLQMPRFSFSSTNHHHHQRSGKAIKIDNSA